MRKQRRKEKFLMEKTAQIERDEKMRKLEFENAILRKNLPKVNGKQVCNRDISFTCSSRMMMHLRQDKNWIILHHFNFSITEFRKSNSVLMILLLRKVSLVAFLKAV